MDRSKIEERLHELATSSRGRSETDRLRDVFPSVEKAIAAGVGRKAVLEALHADGFTMSMKMFDKALYRIRKGEKSKSGLTLERNASKPIKSSREAEVTHAPKPPTNFRKLREDLDKMDLDALISGEGKKP